MRRDRLDLIRARLAAGGYGHTAGLDIAYLIGMIEMQERLNGDRTRRTDGDEDHG